MDTVRLRWMSARDEDAVLDAGSLFDQPPRRRWAEKFLEERGHHLCVAYLQGVPAGFVSGVELTHPDKGTEMFLYELGVDDAFRRRGVGRALVLALAERAREADCYGMWVLTGEDNPAAQATYFGTGATGGGTHLMLEWDLSEEPEAGPEED
jgi:ribosomal protein S18 acetylase RimI-like enzyme